MASDLDAMLLSLMAANPSLMVGLVGAEAKKEPSKPREIKAPSEDFFLILLSGCETCNVVTKVVYSMKWDGISRCFRQSIFRSPLSGKPKIELQRTTSRTCASCVSTLESLSHTELVALTMSFTDPEASMIRLGKLKTTLRKMTIEDAGSPEGRL